MYYSDEHFDEIAEKASVMTVNDIFLTKDILRQAIRNYFSRMLVDHDNNNHLTGCYPIFRNQDYFGLSELELPNVDEMYKDNEGHIWIHIEGNDDYTWSELDEYDTDDMVAFIQEIENQ